MNFHERKAERRKRFIKWQYGWVLQDCTACNGSGYYDNTGSPPCGCCEGTGKELVRGKKSKDLEAALEKIQNHFNALRSDDALKGLTDKQIINCMIAYNKASLRDPDNEELKKSYEAQLKYLPLFAPALN